MQHTNGSTALVDLDGFRSSMRAAGIEEIVDSILSVFVEESRELFDTLEVSFASSDSDSVRRAAHTLKASSGNIQARELAKLVESIESSVATGDLEGVNALIEQARSKYSSVMGYLSEHGYGC